MDVNELFDPRQPMIEHWICNKCGKNAILFQNKDHTYSCRNCGGKIIFQKRPAECKICKTVGVDLKPYRKSEKESWEWYCPQHFPKEQDK